MLLVRSKESKSLNNKSSKNLLKTFRYALPCILFSNFVQAETAANEFAGSGSIINIFLSLCLVIGIILSLAWLARRFNVTQSGSGQLKIVASMLAGGKEKIMVIEVGDEQHLLGITANNINHLAKLDKPLITSNEAIHSKKSASTSFQSKLLEAMSQNIRGNNQKGTT